MNMNDKQASSDREIDEEEKQGLMEAQININLAQHPSI